MPQLSLPKLERIQSIHCFYWGIQHGPLQKQLRQGLKGKRSDINPIENACYGLIRMSV